MNRGPSLAGVLALLGAAAPGGVGAIGLCEGTADETTFRGFAPDGRVAIGREVETCAESEEGGEDRRRHRFVEIRDPTGRVIVWGLESGDAEVVRSRSDGPPTEGPLMNPAATARSLASFTRPAPAPKLGDCAVRFELGPLRETESETLRDVTLVVERGPAVRLELPVGEMDPRAEEDPAVELYASPALRTFAARVSWATWIDQGALGGETVSHSAVLLPDLAQRTSVAPCFATPNAKTTPAPASTPGPALAPTPGLAPANPSPATPNPAPPTTAPAPTATPTPHP